MSNRLLRRIRGGLTPEQIALLPLELQEARLRYITETDDELLSIQATFPPKWHPRKWYEDNGTQMV